MQSLVKIPSEDLMECKATIDFPYLIMRTSKSVAIEINRKLTCFHEENDMLYDPYGAGIKKF